MANFSFDFDEHSWEAIDTYIFSNVFLKLAQFKNIAIITDMHVLLWECSNIKASANIMDNY